jgi:hypothetical protein
VKKLWSDHLALTRIGIELLGQLKTTTTTTKQQQQNNNNKTTKQ